MRQSLPIDRIKNAFLNTIESGRVVLTAPTGSGKSTAVPRWCARLGRVLVIEPRRVACRGLADWVATLESSRLGDTVGYSVKDDHRFHDTSRIVFATPGVVIRWMTDSKSLPFDVVILDEFHERSLEVDLLYALLKKRFSGKLVVMSATMAAAYIAEDLGATLVEGEGRRFDVDVRYIADDVLMPTVRGVFSRITKAVKKAEKMGLMGDLLVFLPGKSEIAKASEQLCHATSREVLQVHGGLRLSEQNRVFEPHDRPRIILSTNVAETSITIPNIDAVIDSGLVRRTRYAHGRGFLTLSPIAKDSADQRAGRAGRVKAGVCFRLWSEEALLQPLTPPEIHRESLTPLLLAAAACDEKMGELPFLDPPKPYAVEAATSELSSLRAISLDGEITQRGRALFGFPLDAPLANLLVESENEGCLLDAIDLVSALSVGRPLFKNSRPSDPILDFRIDGCDAISHIRAVREGEAGLHHLHGHVLNEARHIRQRLSAGWSLPQKVDSKAPIDRNALIRAALRADPTSAFIARRRRGKVFWAGGGQEILLAKESGVDEEKTEAIALLASMAIGEGHRKDMVYATAAMPIRFRDFVAAGLGEEKVSKAVINKDGVLVCEVERVFSKKTIEKREEIPSGQMAQEGVLQLLLRGRLYRTTVEETAARLKTATLGKQLKRRGLGLEDIDLGEWESEPVPELETYLRERIAEIGVASGDDVPLLSADDFLAPPLPEETSAMLSLKYPTALLLGNAKYAVEYDTVQGEVTLVRVDGTHKHPPSLSVLPAFRGFTVKVKHHSKVWVLKKR